MVKYWDFLQLDMLVFCLNNVYTHRSRMKIRPPKDLEDFIDFDYKEYVILNFTRPAGYSGLGTKLFGSGGTLAYSRFKSC